MSGARKSKAYSTTTGGTPNRTLSKKPAESMTRTQLAHGSTVLMSQSRIGDSTIQGRKNTQASGSDKAPPPLIKMAIQVFDDHGHDVTPLPLIEVDPLMHGRKLTNILDSSATTTVDMGGSSIYQTGTVTASTFGGGPFNRSVFSSHSGRSTYLGSASEDIAESVGEEVTSAWTETKVRYKREEVKEELSEEELERPVAISLTETDTIWLLDIIGVAVSLEADEAEHIKERNATYDARRARRKLEKADVQFLVKSRPGNDRYVERGMNTFNELPKVKNIQTNKISYSDAGIMVTRWDMADSYELAAKLEAKAKAEQPPEAELLVSGVDSASTKDNKVDISTTPTPDATSSSLKKTVNITSDEEGSDTKTSTVATVQRTTVCSQTTMSTEVDSLLRGTLKTPDGSATISEAEIFQTEAFQRDLVIMERVVNLNTYQPKLAAYRSFTIIEDMDKKPVSEAGEGDDSSADTVVVRPHSPSIIDTGPNLDRLWAFHCNLTKDHNISCVSWNRVNPDLIAVSYGQYDFAKQKGGIICCWSLKNPEYPERVYTCQCGVMSIAFSQMHPNLLAAGLYDGTVAIYNVRSTSNESVLDSLDASGKHICPVWQLEWIEKDRGTGDDKTEVLVSVSTDGRVTQWSIRKGLESYDLMKLKKVIQKQSGGIKTKKAEAFISRFASGLCFAFTQHDSNIYLVGTEEGHIHRCSCSYNEQYLDSYHGHTGPVYNIEWSPFCPEMFLSCSGDWSIRLWHQERTEPILTFLSSTRGVPDIAWSLTSSTVFACVNEGTIEVWDLSQSTLDPIIVHTPPSNVQLSTVSFSKNSECIVVGDSEGHLGVYQLKGMPPPPTKQAFALHKIIKTTLATQIK